MHVRRMEPQPWHPQSVPMEKPEQFRTQGEGPGAWGALDEHGHLVVARAPSDMEGAAPWKDSDGTWYWRRSI